MTAIRAKRIYDPPAPDDGARILVDRIWPRGVAKDSARLDRWMKDAAPSADLRRWFGHRPERWDEFKRRYADELAASPVLGELRKIAADGPLTLLYAARDPVHNNAAALAAYLSDAPAPELASPACSMHEADDAYMGFAARDELSAFLNELLEAERAGAQVTARTAHQANDQGLARLMRDIEKDEARWCAMLHRHLTALGADPSPKVGDFCDKAMAIADLRQRIAFINRGQGWVVRKLKEMLPRVRDDALHRDLAAMLRAHEDNIARANDALGRPA